MRSRIFVVLGLLGALVVTGSAQAAKVKPTCKLVVDGKADNKLSPTGNGGVPGSPSTDIVSADVASNATTLTAVVRVAKLANPDPQSPLGQAWAVYFLAPRNPTLYFLVARAYPTGNHFYFGYQGSDPNLPLTTLYPVYEGKGVLDLAKSEVRISVPLKAIASTVKLPKGSRLGSLEAKAMEIAGQGVVPSQNVGPARAPLGGLSETMDDAVGKTTYPMGAPSCVAVGK